MTIQDCRPQVALGRKWRSWSSWMGRAGKKRGIWTFALLGLLAAAGVVGWLFPLQILYLDSGDVRADVLVVLGGGAQERPARAAELFRSGAAPRIIVSGAGDCTNNLLILMAAGVPGRAIELEGRSETTRENAAFSIALLRAAGAKSAIIVTSWYHSRRALACFEHYAPDIKFYSRPSRNAYPRSEWSHAGLWHYIRAEYLKIPGYWLRYGICPF